MSFLNLMIQSYCFLGFLGGWEVDFLRSDRETLKSKLPFRSDPFDRQLLSSCGNGNRAERGNHQSVSSIDGREPSRRFPRLIWIVQKKLICIFNQNMGAVGYH